MRCVGQSEISSELILGSRTPSRQEERKALAAQTRRRLTIQNQ